MSLTHTGPGRVLTFGQNAEGLWGRLYNFDIDGHELKQAHREFLTTRIIPMLRAGGSIRLIALASRSGNSGHNAHLSSRRLAAVVAFLRAGAGPQFQVAEQSAAGEVAAAQAGVPDDTEHENWRSVVFSAWRRPVPPPPPPAPPAPAPSLMSRTVRRTWALTPRMRVSEPDGSGGGGAALGDLAMRAINPTFSESPPSQQMVLSTHAVTLIRVTRETVQSPLASHDLIHVSYEWGPRQATVRFQEYGSPERQLSWDEARRWIERPSECLFRPR